MSVRAQAALDARFNLALDGDAIVLIDDAGKEYPTRGRVFRTDQSIDPLSGVLVHSPRLSVQVPLADIVVTPDERWTARTTDVTGKAVVGGVVNVEIDRTIGFVSFNIEVF